MIVVAVAFERVIGVIWGNIGYFGVMWDISILLIYINCVILFFSESRPPLEHWTWHIAWVRWWWLLVTFAPA